MVLLIIIYLAYKAAVTSMDNNDIKKHCFITKGKLVVNSDYNETTHWIIISHNNNG